MKSQVQTPAVCLVCNSVVRRVIMPFAGCGWIACHQSSLLTASVYGLGWETSEAHFQGKGRLFFAQSPETACISPQHASVYSMHQPTACISPWRASAHSMHQPTAYISPQHASAHGMHQPTSSWPDCVKTDFTQCVLKSTS